MLSRIIFFAFSFSMAMAVSSEAQTGKIKYPSLNLAFEVPDGWKGQESQGMYVMGHMTIPGILAVLPHQQPMTVDDMKAEARYGIMIDNGTSFRPVSAMSTLADNAIGGEFSGLLDYMPAQAYIIGLSNPSGTGLTIIAVTSPEAYDADTYRGLAMEVMRSVEFGSTGDIPGSQNSGNADVADWKYQLGGTKLTWMESYYSGGEYGGGYNMKTEIHLCEAGYFLYYDQSLVAAGGVDVSGYSGGSSRGHGNWDIAVSGGVPYLVLNFHDGNKRQFSLEWREGSKLFMDGYRYMRTWEGEYAPNCY
jgi:hypothetical protein